MLPYLRTDLAQLVAYTPHPGGTGTHAASAKDPQTLDRLDTNESPVDLSDELKQKLSGLVQQEIESNRYPDGSHAELKGAIAKYVTESAVLTTPLDLTQISVSNGSDELIRSILIATCLNGAGSILVAQPTFSMYGITAQTLGISVVTVGRSPDSFEMDLSGAQTAIAQTQNPPIRVVFVVHPNSPTGNALTAAELEWLRSLPDHILVVVDEAYFEFSQATVVAELAQHSNWVVLRTLSKAFRLAGHRVGYAIAHPELIAALEKVRLPYNLPSLSQAAAELAIAHRDTLLSTIPALLSERDQLFSIWSSHPRLRVWSSDANFIFLRLKGEDGSTDQSETTLDQVFQQLRAEGTLVRKISGGLRITIGTPSENQRTVERLQAILDAL
ncbi:MAG: histidinol-phosphate transaminase [Oculatellaceae cyanobacterium bins.114]|nr:histidinol-phosphate transaminase [Oculatellaceae cyanobacterium bins.114]